MRYGSITVTIVLVALVVALGSLTWWGGVPTLSAEATLALAVICSGVMTATQASHRRRVKATLS